MTLARFNGVVQDALGNAVASAHIEVRREVSGQPLAAVYSDRDGVSSLGNPFDAESDGTFGFHADDGTYQIRAYTGPSGAPTFERIMRYVALIDSPIPEGVTVVASLSDLKALDATTTAFLTAEGRRGVFLRNLGDYTDEIAIDTQEGIYVLPDGVDPDEGAWVRVYDGPLEVSWFGAVYGDVSDCSTALAAADAVAVELGRGLLVTGAMKMSSNVTVESHVRIDFGGMIAPDSGVKIALSAGLEAGTYKVFDYADRTCRVWVNEGVVRGEWWGADGGITGGNFNKLNNDIPIQQALDSVGDAWLNFATYPFSWGGGEIRYRSGYYNMEKGVVMHNYTTIRGEGRATIFMPSETTWAFTEDYLFRGYLENTASPPAPRSQFNVRLENCRIKGNGINVLHQYLAESWNEQCGVYNVHFDEIHTNGLTFMEGYGGTATFEIRESEFWFLNGAAFAGRGINIDGESMGSTLGWTNVIISHCVVVSADPDQDNRVGIYADGRVLLVVNGYHPESCYEGIHLETDACLEGASINGGPDVGSLIVVNNWNKDEGRINVAAKIGNASFLLKDYDDDYRPYYTLDPMGDGRVVFPPDPNKAIASICLADGGSSPPTTVWSVGNISASVTRSGAGSYAFTLLAALGNVAHYRVRVDHDFISGAAPPQPIIARNNASSFNVNFRDASNSGTDMPEFTVHVLHRP